MNVSANIPFEHISLNKDEKDLLSRIVTKPEYATDKSFGSAERLQHYGLAYITISGNANAPKLKDGATYLIRKSDKGVLESQIKVSIFWRILTRKIKKNLTQKCTTGK